MDGRPPQPLGNDRFEGTFVPDRRAAGVHHPAWVDRFGSWRRDLIRRVDAGQDVASTCRSAPRSCASRKRAAPEDAAELTARLRAVHRQGPARRDRRRARPAARGARRRLPGRRRRDGLRPRARDRRRPRARALQRLVRAVPALARHRAGEPRHVRATSTTRLAYVAAMGFDVLYLPPIHPDRRDATARAATTRPTPEPGDSGSPWAIGGAGGRPHGDPPRARHARRLRRARRRGARARHRDRARHRLPVLARPPVGHRAPRVVPAAARRHDPVRREPAEEVPGHLPVRLRERRLARRCGTALLDVVRVLDRAGRAHLPRRQPAHQAVRRSGSGCIATVKREHPEAIFLAEAFTRPKVMYALAKVGFTQSYTYFTWRNDEVRAAPSTSTELTQTAGRRLLPAELLAEHARHPAPSTCSTAAGRRSCSALVLAATLVAELRHLRPGVRAAWSTSRASRAARSTSTPRSTSSRTGTSTAPTACADADRAGQPHPPRATRRCSTNAHAALPRRPTTTRCSATASDAPDDDDSSSSSSTSIPHHAQPGCVELDLARARARPDDAAFQVHDLLDRRALHVARARANYVELDPASVPAHIFAVARGPHERDFEYVRRRRPLRATSRRLVQGRRHLRAARPRVPRQRRRRHRRLPRPDRRSSTTSQDLGVTAIWLLPFYPSPLRTTATTSPTTRSVNPTYGTLRDFQALPRARRTTAACGSSPSWSSTTPPTSTRGSSAPAARRPGSR